MREFEVKRSCTNVIFDRITYNCHEMTFDV